MKPYVANILTATVLIACGMWAFLQMAPETRSYTVLIPVAFGVVLALFTPGIKREGIVASHVVVVLTLVVAIALFMPLKGAIGRDDSMAIFRVGLMMAVSVFALVVYINSFIQIRRARAKNES